MTAGGGQHIDSWVGFTVHQPAGWQVRVSNSVVSVCQDAAALVQAMFCPIRLDQPVSPTAVAQQFVAWRAAGDPTFQAWVARQEPLLLRTEANAGGRVLNGLYSVVTQGENGLISGFQAPREQAESLAPVLGQVVASFSSVSRVPREQFREPVEGAFTVLYPQGWSAGGSVNRANAFGGAMPGFQVAHGPTSVDNWARTFSFVESIWLLMQGQQKLKYVPAAGFAGTWLPGWLKKQTGPLTVEQVIDRPDQVPQLALEVAKAGVAPDRYDLSCATLQFTQVRNGREFRSRLGVVAQRSRDNGIWSMSMNPTAWSALITSSMHAPAEEFDSVAPVLSGVLDSFQKNPQWESAELMRSHQVSMQMQQQALTASSRYPARLARRPTSSRPDSGSGRPCRTVSPITCRTPSWGVPMSPPQRGRCTACRTEMIRSGATYRGTSSEQRAGLMPTPAWKSSSRSVPRHFLAYAKIGLWSFELAG